MRLFIAILFNKEIENSLYRSIESLKNISKSGTYTLKENLHLTVNFIGETNRVAEVSQAMKTAVDNTGTKSFQLLIRGFGKFKRREGDIYWVGVEREDTLWKLQKGLVRELKGVGFFDIDDMEYTPHLTLGRRVKVKETFQANEFEAGIKPMQMEITRISLMNSERLNGKLVYSEIYHIDLD